METSVSIELQFLYIGLLLIGGAVCFALYAQWRAIKELSKQVKEFTTLEKVTVTGTFVTQEKKEEKAKALASKEEKIKVISRLLENPQRITIPEEALGRMLRTEIEKCTDGRLRNLLYYYWTKVKLSTIVDVMNSNYSPYKIEGVGEGTIQKFRDTYNCPQWWNSPKDAL